MFDSLPLVYSLQEHQRGDAFREDLRRKVENEETAGNNFRVHRGLLCYFYKRARRRRRVVPSSLRQMILRYFHDADFAGHLGARKTFCKIASNSWCPDMRAEVFDYVLKCELCQRAKPALDARVGLHSAQPSSQPMQKLFVDFVGPPVRSRRGNIAILVVVDAFSKFVSFYPVRRITSRVVLDCLEKGFFPRLARLSTFYGQR
jgi:hypothetical protein